VGQALPGVADSAVDLDGGLADRQGGVSGIGLGDPRGVQRRSGTALVHRPGGIPEDRHRPLDQRQAFGEQVRDSLVRPDGMAVLGADLGVVQREGVRATRRADHFGGRDDHRERLPPQGVRGRDLARRLQRAVHRGHEAGQVHACRRRAQGCRQQPRSLHRQPPREALRVRGDAVDHGRRRLRGRLEGICQHRTEERHVHQASREFLGDERDLDAGGTLRAQGPPSGSRDGLLQPSSAFFIG
jgi:hypothetical protein